MTTPHDRYDLLCRATRRRRDDSPLSAGLAALENLLRHDLRALARQGSPDNFADILFALEQELQRFRDFCEFPDLAQKTIVGFGGAFSAGKSSLINALVGKRAVQVAADPTTALPTYLLRGTEASVVALNMFRQRVVLSEAEFASLTHEEAENHGSNVGELLQSAFVTDPDFAWDSLAFLDTPGYSKPDSESWGERTDEAIARAQLNTAHVLVWVVSAKAGTLPEEDLAFLASLRADLPRIVVVTHADAHPAAETAKVVAMMAQTLAERALPALAVIPVRANRPKSDYPLTPLLTQLDDWNQQTRALSFARHFKQQFTAYARFLEGEQRRAQQNLNWLNRILMLADTDEIRTSATALRDAARAELARLTKTSNQLDTLRQTFFTEIKVMGARVGTPIFEPVDMLDLLHQARTARGMPEPEGQPYWSDLMVKLEEQSIASFLKSHVHNGGIPEAASLLRQNLPSHPVAECDALTRVIYLSSMLRDDSDEPDESTRLLFRVHFCMLRLEFMLEDEEGFGAKMQVLIEEQFGGEPSDEDLYCFLKDKSLALVFMLDALMLYRLISPFSISQSKILSESASFLEVEASDLPMLGLSKLMVESEGQNIASLLAQQALPSHFAANCDIHTRETYATFLAALLLLKGEVSVTENRLFKLLLGALKLGEDSHTQLFAQAQQLDQTKLEAFCRLAEEEGLGLSFMLDAMVLCRLDRPISIRQGEVLLGLAEMLAVEARILPMLSRLATGVLGVPNDTDWEGEWTFSPFCVWDDWLEMPLTEDALKAGIRGGRWVLSQDLEVNFPWTMDGAVVCFANQATLSTVGAEGQVTIRNSQLWLPRLGFDGAMKLAVTGVQVSGKWHEAANGWSAFKVTNLAQCTVADSTFNTPNRTAIYLRNTPAQLQGCRFVDCGSARTNGGGLFASNGGQLLEINGSEFLRCAGNNGGGVYVEGDATLTDCSFIDCTSTGNEGRSAAGGFWTPLVDTLKNCRFVRSSVRGQYIGQRDNTTKKITFCAGSSFTSCDLNHYRVQGGSVVDQDNTFAGGQCKYVP